MNWLPVSEHRFKLGEGSFWDVEQQALYWVDISGFLACRLLDGEYRQWRMPEPVSAFIPTQRGDALVTLASGVYRLDLNSTKTSLSLFCVADPVSGNRANESRCDAQGRLWLGSMQNNIDAEGGDVPLVRRSGGLFRIDPDASVTRLLDRQGIVNTLLWNASAECCTAPTRWMKSSINTRFWQTAALDRARSGQPNSHVDHPTDRRWMPKAMSGTPVGVAAA